MNMLYTSQRHDHLPVASSSAISYWKEWHRSFPANQRRLQINEMRELRFQDGIGDMSDALDLINPYYWGIEIREILDKSDRLKWVVNSGEKALFVTDNKECLVSFIYGMALSYSIIPQDYVDRFREEYKEDE